MKNKKQEPRAVVRGSCYQLSEKRRYDYSAVSGVLTTAAPFSLRVMTLSQ